MSFPESFYMRVEWIWKLTGENGINILPMQKALYFHQGWQKEKNMSHFVWKLCLFGKWPFVGGEKKQIGRSLFFFFFFFWRARERWHDDSPAIAGTWKPTTLIAAATCACYIGLSALRLSVLATLHLQLMMFSLLVWGKKNKKTKKKNSTKEPRYLNLINNDSYHYSVSL